MTNLQQPVTVSLLKHYRVEQFTICLSMRVLVTKYRRKVITGNVLRRLQEICEDLCKKWDCQLVEFNGESDHCHLLIDINPKVQISAFANNLKTVTSRLKRIRIS